MLIKPSRRIKQKEKRIFLKCKFHILSYKALIVLVFLHTHTQNINNLKRGLKDETLDKYFWV